ncbi:CLUMA_CG010221, isoform A [Clunio marinus]|uniref:CLUMA_CG010221, isoform A n=1 Tax=Clunio marinus TaxID=568069 RepID=A0A1J1IAS5_9DIPT|nr:CLUMA_CG010221, isoform A [Clunio marinus]
MERIKCQFVVVQAHFMHLVTRQEVKEQTSNFYASFVCYASGCPGIFEFSGEDILLHASQSCRFCVKKWKVKQETAVLIPSSNSTVWTSSHALLREYL